MTKPTALMGESLVEAETHAAILEGIANAARPAVPGDVQELVDQAHRARDFQRARATADNVWAGIEEMAARSNGGVTAKINRACLGHAHEEDTCYKGSNGIRLKVKFTAAVNGKVQTSTLMTNISADYIIVSRYGTRLYFDGAHDSVSDATKLVRFIATEAVKSGVKFKL